MSHAEKVKPFDFVVEEQLVREPLQSLVTSLGISAVCTCPLSLQHASYKPHQNLDLLPSLCAPRVSFSGPVTSLYVECG